MNFLVTGGAGFIGSHVCERLLRSGHAVWALDDLNPFYDPECKRRNLREVEALGKPFHFAHADIADRRAVDEAIGNAKFDQIIHLAARAGVRPSLTEPALCQRVNVEGTVNVLDPHLAGIKKLTIASSSSVYGVNSKVPFSEKDPISSPISPYAASKLACEALGHVYHHIYHLDIVMLRLFTVYGPRQRPDLAIFKFARLITAGKPIPVFGDPDKSGRDYTYIADIVDGIMACTGAEFGYEIFNLGESQTITLSRMIELLERALGKKAVLERQPMQPGDVPLTFADISKARAQLGYQPRTKFERGILRFAEWFKKNSA